MAGEERPGVRNQARPMVELVRGRASRLKHMVPIPAGTFTMGSDDFYPEERPAHPVALDTFWIDEHPVTNAEFRRFQKATGYVTVAERPLDPAAYPDPDPALLVPGSVVFTKAAGPVPLSDALQWWRYQPGANWRHPEGPDSTLDGRDRHPVVHVTHEDADAFASWADKDLPTEAEWECAARGGLDAAIFPWGDEAEPKGRPMANTWEGQFPWENVMVDGFEGTSPVGTFPANGYGLFDVSGNVWEWTSDWFTSRHPDPAPSPCCVPHNPRVTSDAGAFVAGQAGADIPRRVIKGGSHLCAPSYCFRYRPAARQGEAIDTSTSHIGFRCVSREQGPQSAV